MNILIKLTCLIGLVVAPILGGHSQDESAVANQDVEVKVTFDENDSDSVTAKVKYITNENGVETVVEKTFSGSDNEVKGQLEDFEESIVSNGSEQQVIKKVEITKE